MALQLAKSNEKPNTPNTVKGMVARRWSSLEHQALSRGKNEKAIKQSSQNLRRIHDAGS